MARTRSVSMILGILLLLSVIIWGSSAASAEGLVLDYSDDFASYARAVALLHRTQDMMPLNTPDDPQAVPAYYAMLCKTNGREIDFSDLAPLCVVMGPRNCYTLFFPTEESCANAVDILLRAEGIIYAEADCEVHATGTEENSEAQETSPWTFHSWGASQMNFGDYINYVASWGSGSVSVAVVDSGVFPHSLIRGKLLSSGYDYVDGDEDSSNDLFGHGTNVAGIIADCTADAPVYIYPIRVLNANGSGKMSNVVNAVREASSKGVSIINLSLESPVMSAALDDAILEAVSAGIVVVVAAGNSACNTADVCPAHLTNSGVVVVGSAEVHNGLYARASYSNYGTSVDLYCFGTGISCCSRSGGYSSATGTSMAAPHASALCALLRLIHPGLSPGQCERRLQRAALGDGAIIVPDAGLMVPRTRGSSLTSVKMSVGDSLPLPASAYPLSSCETVSYSSSDEQIVQYSNGSLIASKVGSARVNVSCKGFEEMAFQVIVDDQQDTIIRLPEQTEYIEDEAFLGATAIAHAIIPGSVSAIGNDIFHDCLSLRTISIPDSVRSIGVNTFSDAVVICRYGSTAYEFALGHGLQYIAYE